MKKVLKRIYRKINGWKFELLKKENELIYCEKFKFTIRGSNWFDKKCSISPGGWAVGYPYLYALYRILNEGKPKNILDIGLGQSSKMISYYMQKNFQEDDVIHLIVEHDKNWVEFMKSNFNLSNKSFVQLLDLEEKKYFDSRHATYSYKEFEDIIDKQNIKWNLISIDAPFGGEEYSRMDVLNILPRHLAEDFIIIIDDYERTGEYNMVECIKKILNENQIEYAKGIYSGEKEVCVLTSENLNWFTSL